MKIWYILNHYDFHPDPVKKKPHKYLELELIEEHWILIFPLELRDFFLSLCFSIFACS